MLSFIVLLAALALSSTVYGHPESSSPFSNHPAELSRRQLEMNKRHVMARACAPQVAEYQRQRKARRALRRRGIHVDDIDIKGLHFGHGHPNHPNPPNTRTRHSEHHQPTSTVTRNPGLSTSVVRTSEVLTSTRSAASPHYSTIQNLSGVLFDKLVLQTCVTAPEVAEATIRLGAHLAESSPYYLRDNYVRGDVREGQAGTTLYLDIGVIDITTCTPSQGVFVEIWGCNPQGIYSSFGAGPTINSTDPSGSNTFTFTFPTMSGPIPTDIVFPPVADVPKANTENFLRGGLPADANGMVEMTSNKHSDH
ncbi:hypothetical protein FRC17_000160 [Serendipita sp. 399]|nr:hypothetical protein FRC17_000160 [Serendipita sp. 399]